MAVIERKTNTNFSLLRENFDCHWSSLLFDIMGNRKISHDVKIAAIWLYEWQLLHLDDILDCCGFSERTFYRILKLWQETGDVINPSRSLRG